MILLEADKDPSLLGEDTCDLFALIEESFGISMGNYQDLVGKTVLEITECITKQSKHQPAECCLSMTAFYRLRAVFISSFGIQRKMVRSNSKLRDLLPWITRRRRWRALQRELGLSLPSLVYPAWLACIALVIGLATGFVVDNTETQHGAVINGLEVVGGFTTALIAAIWLLMPLARGLPKGCASFGALARLALARNYSVVASELGSCSKEQLLPLLRQLIAAEVGIDVENIKAETLIPQGLNIY
jgi:hypothetical protein